MTIPLSLYIHFPWCLKRCPYCDFNAHTLKGDLPEDNYIDALIDDLKLQITTFNETRPIHSIFMGGGTPSLIKPKAIGRLLNSINDYIPLPETTEITLEANPGSILDDKQLRAYRNAGVNRLSVGVQSFNEHHLKKLGRIHNPLQALNTIHNAHKAGFDRLNIDIMYGLPEQTLTEAVNDLTQACDLPVDHVSWYQLTIEPNTLFHHQRPNLPDEDTIEAIEQTGRSLLKNNGFDRYEVSAYSKRSPSQHNLNYWHFGDYLGIGAGAHGKISNQKEQRITRTNLLKHPSRYLSSTADERLNTAPIEPNQQSFEFALNAFRLTNGFDEALIKTRCFDDNNKVNTLLEEAENNGWITRNNGWVQPTDLGQRYLNDLSSLFLAP